MLNSLSVDLEKILDDESTYMKFRNDLVLRIKEIDKK